MPNQNISIPINDRFFPKKKGVRYCEHVSLKTLSQIIPTPFYAYSKACLCHHAHNFKTILAALPHETELCYAVKANGLIEILKNIRTYGYGADIVSGGELTRARQAQIPTEKIVFSGVGKTEKEIKDAQNAGIRQINIESEQELETILTLASKANPIPCALRVNPDTKAPTHAKIATGNKNDKFGIAYEDILPLAQKIHQDDRLTFMGLATHIGSNIHDPKAFQDAFTKINQLAITLQQNALPVASIDLGGGLADASHSSTLIAYRELVKNIFHRYRGTLIFEPGRAIVAACGILVARILYIKNNTLIIDAGMNNMMRTALYHDEHGIITIEDTNTKNSHYHVAGPICESTDIFATNLTLCQQKSQNTLAIINSGAYGSTMQSLYNARPFIQEILIDGTTYQTIRKPFTTEDALKLEHMP